MTTKLGMESIIPNGKHKGEKVADLVHTKGCIFSMVKAGLDFEDDVLAEAHITRHVRDVKTYIKIGNPVKVKEKELPIDKTPLSQILRELNGELDYKNKKGDEIPMTYNNIIDNNEGEDE